MSRAEFTAGIVRCLHYTDRRVGETLPPPSAPARAPAFSLGDRVIAPPSPGARDPAFRAGGPGKIVEVRTRPDVICQMVYVTVDGATDIPMVYDARELRREPTI